MSNSFAYRENHKLRLSQMSLVLQKVKGLMQELPKFVEDGNQLNIEDTINQLEKKISQRLQRVSSSYCRVCVIGLEKQGKSSFVNAWIGEDVLPYNLDRCTWAASTIVNSSQYRLEAEFITNNDFENHINALYDKMEKKRSEYPFPIDESSPLDRSSVRESKEYKELLNLSKYYPKIKPNLNHSPLNMTFGSLVELQDNLYKYIALRDKDGNIQGGAYAVKSANIHFNLGTDAEFCIDDLPGIDAPGNRAEEMTWKAVEDFADLVVFVKDASNNADLNRTEEEVWDRARRADPAIKLSQRIFVVLNKADRSNIVHKRNCHSVAADNFKSLGVHSSRIFYCSPHAELFEQHKGSELPFDYDPADHENNKNKITLLYGGNREQTTGFPEFKLAIDGFIKNDLRRLEEDALDVLTREFDACCRDVEVMLGKLTDTSFSADNASALEIKCFEELWNPSSSEKRGREGLRNFLNSKVNEFCRNILVSSEEKKHFCDSIQKQIADCQKDFKDGITLEDFNLEDYHQSHTARKDLEDMRIKYRSRKYRALKQKIYTDLASSISRSVKNTLLSCYACAVSAKPDNGTGTSFETIGHANIINSLIPYKDNFFAKTVVETESESELQSGFKAILTSIAYAPLEYLMLASDADKKLSLLEKARIYSNMVSNPKISAAFKHKLKDGTTLNVDSNDSVFAFCKENIDLVADILSTFVPGGAIAKRFVSAGVKQVTNSLAKENSLANNGSAKGKLLKNFKSADAEEADDQPLNEENIVSEMRESVDTFFMVLQSMLFDDDYGFIGYYLGMLENFRLDWESVLDNAFSTLAFRHRTVLWPDVEEFRQSEARKELEHKMNSLRNILHEATF